MLVLDGIKFPRCRRCKGPSTRALCQDCTREVILELCLVSPDIAEVQVSRSGRVYHNGKLLLKARNQED